MEQEKITQTVSNLFDGTDRHNWTMVENAMAENIVLDFSSMTGESASTKTATQIVENWAAFLPGFDKTHHQLSNFEVRQHGNIATAHYSGKADHYIGPDVWTVEGTYDTELSKTNNDWLITKHTFNFTRQTGNINLPAKALEIMKSKAIRKVQFISEGLVLKGNLHVPPEFPENKNA
ncbi:nuclear transport factor 2 family protein [Taibaiella koreensis]|uniref:nuclear transport factor 2 family protein n=1 Tax=Taibaiella koreensis TaxID=1268548 RepID=UPI000E59AEC1|nr:nuclear transport factor 2 family protein [Taibaiella koreensis]